MTGSPKPSRLTSIDTVRGLIMVVMALDHARDFLGLKAFVATDLSHTTAAYFMTRWVTHFCAPGFMFLAGVSAFLSSRQKSKPELTRFLLSRGLWLVFAELTFISWAWQFSFSAPRFLVIWALGWSMVFLAAMIWLPRWLVATLSVAIIASHNLLDGFHVTPQGAMEWAFAVMHQRAPPVGYPLIPWVAVMALGFVMGPVFTLETFQRRRVLIIAGLSCIAGFVLVRATNWYGDSSPWVPQSDALFTVFSFVNTSKYPPSLLYLLMTLGPIFLLLAAAELVTAPVLLVFGRVPFFFYALHLVLLHLMALVVAANQGFEVSQVLTWFVSFPQAYGLGLGPVYLGWVGVVVALYWPCRWFAGVKARRRDWWLSYL